MGVCVIVLGKSGSGKSTSLRNFEPGEVGVLNVMGKPLPFRKRLDSTNTQDYRTIRACITSGKRRAWVVDDAGYLLSLENFARARESDGGADALMRLVTGYRTRKAVLDAATADGELPDGCRMVERSEPARWLGTTLRVKPEKVAQALAGELPQAVAGLLGGEVG